MAEEGRPGRDEASFERGYNQGTAKFGPEGKEALGTESPAAGGLSELDGS